MEEDIPSSNDLIVIGTGLTESIIAAAASRVGKKVLHIDHRDYYGSNWATFSFSSLNNTLPQQKPIKNTDASTGEGDNEVLNLDCSASSFQNVCEQWFCPDTQTNCASEAEAEEEHKQAENLPKSSTVLWTKTELLKQSRKFNFDLTPKILYSRGEMVEVLISSGICRYAEFKNVFSIHTYDGDENRLITVPCSRADVFNSKDITMVEKRLLMKTLTICSDSEKNSKDFEEWKNLGEFLSAHKIHGKIRRYMVDTVAMASEETDIPTAMKSVQKFVRSIGRYGNTPFLWTLYGSGELPQCFCRCSAVFGGIYCLKRQTQNITVGSDGLAMGIKTEDRLLKAPFVVIEDSLNPKSTLMSGTSRAILLTDKALVGDQVTLINFPGKDPIRILELSASAMACPRGLFVVHFITKQKTTAQEDLKEAVETLFPGGSNILWSLHFNINLYQSDSKDLPSNVYSSPGPDCSLDFDDYVIQAKKIFQSMFPDDEFLPRVPDPEDIILEGPEETQKTLDDAVPSTENT